MVRLLTFSAVVMTLVVTVASPERIGFFTSIFSIDLDGINIQDLCFTPESGGSVLGRVSMSIDALSMWFSEPILGVGPGNFGLLDCDVNPKRDGTHPHNIFFGLLSELGLIGLLWFAAIVLIPIVKVLRIEHSLFLGQIIILFSFELGQSFFISSGYLGNFGIYLFIGIIVTSGLRSSNRRVVKEPLVKQ
jgi:O-antigen ligase